MRLHPKRIIQHPEDTNKWWMPLLSLLYAQTHGNNTSIQEFQEASSFLVGELFTPWKNLNSQHRGKYLVEPRKKE